MKEISQRYNRATPFLKAMRELPFFMVWESRKLSQPLKLH